MEMKVAILAGGKGTRLMDETQGKLPKPLVPVKGKSLVEHVIDAYCDQGYCDAEVLAGYMKLEMVAALVGRAGIHVLDTGEETQTGGRLKRASALLPWTFMATYADGLADVNYAALLEHHRRMVKEHGVVVTLTAHPQTSRFGVLHLADGLVRSFGEKADIISTWVNIGFYVMEQEIMELIPGDACVLERDVLPALAEQGRLAAFPHFGYFQCVDTWRDLEAANAAPDPPPWRRFAGKRD
jgi:glucose-1-phosphate cytidylyltransferase